MHEAISVETSGFDELSDLLEQYQVTEESSLDAMEEGAKLLAQDIQRLPKPRSRISKAGHTHLLDTVTYRRNAGNVEVGWGKFYGFFLENGTKKMRAQAHIRPTFTQNKDRYMQAITKKLFGGK